MKHFYATLLALFSVFVMVAQCNYTLELRDNFNNGWGGGSQVTVTLNGTPTSYTLPDPPGNQTVYTITVNDGDTLLVDYIADPTFPGDNEFTLFDSEGITVVDSGFTPASGNYFNGTASCPTCPAVSNISATNVVSDGADIAWTPGGSESEWIIEYGVAPYTCGSGGVQTTVTTNPATITGLNSETDYDIYVIAVCGPSDQSACQGPVSISTTVSCPAPGAFTPAGNSASSIQFAWDANGNPSPNSEIEYGVSPYTQGSGGTTVQQFTGNFAIVTGLMSDTTYDFYVRMDCGMGDFSSWSGPYTNNTLISCPAMGNVQTINTTANSIELDWVAGGVETEWEINYAPAGVITTPFATTTQGLLDTVSGLPELTLSGLTDSTTYEIYIRSVCDPALPDFSSPTLYVENTTCTAFTAPYFTNFESDPLNELGICDESIVVGSGTGTAPWVRVDDLTSNSGTQHIYIYSGSTGATGDYYYISPEFSDLDSNKRVRFFAYDRDNGEIEVGVMTDPTDATTFTSVQTFTDADLADDQYQLVRVDFTSITTTGGHIAIKYNAPGTFDAFYLDDFIYESIPTCPEPLDLEVNSVADTSMDLSWTQGGSETEWIVEYATPSFAVGTVQQVTNVTSNTNYILSGLTSNTPYEVRVVAVCAPSDLSPPTFAVITRTNPDGPTGVTCPNNNAAFIWEETFDSNASGWTGTVGTSTGQWEFGQSAGTGSTGTGPLGPQEGSGYVFFDTSGTNIGPVSMVSPAIDLTLATSDAEISFFFHSFGGDLTTFEIGVGTSATGPFTNVFTYVGPLQSNQTDDFAILGAALPASVLGNPTVYIQLTATEEAGNESGYVGDVALDLMRIETCADICSNPDTLAVDNLNATSVDISFNDTNGSPSGNYEYVIQTPGTGIPTAAGTAITSTLFTESGLTPATDYEVYVRTNCGAFGFSDWIGPVTFTTPCVPFTAPYTNNFDSDPLDALFVCDSNLITGGGTSTVVEVEDLIANSGSRHIYMYSGSPAPTDFFYISPEFSDLSNDKRVRFFAYDRDNGGIEVGVMTDPTDAATFTSVQTFTDADLADDQYQLVTVNFTSITTTGGHVAIKYNAPGTFDAMYIDDFVYEMIPNCPEPSALTLNAVSDSTMDLSWVAGNAETEWIVEYATPDFATGTLQQVTGVTSNTNYILPGLTSNTSYEVRVVAVCSPTDLSPGSFPITARTNPEGPSGVVCPNNNAAFIWQDSFDANNGWTGTVGTSTGQWEFGQSAGTGSTGTGPLGPQEGTGYVFFDTSGTNVGPNSAVSPPIDLSLAVADAELSFFFHSFGGDLTTFEVGVGTSATGPFTNIFTYSGPLQTNQTDDFALVGASLPASVLGSSTVYIQLTATEEVGNETGFVGDVALDLMRIESCADICSNPDTLAVDSLSATSVDISFNDTNGTPSGNYEYVVQTPGTGIPTAAGTAITSTMFTESGLTPATDYEVYVRANCGTLGFSDWVGPVTFTTPCVPYTAPYSNNFDSDPLDALFICDSNLITGGGTTTTVEVEDLIANSGSRHIYMYSGSPAPTDFFYISPEFSDLSNDKRVRFFAYDRDNGGIEVGVMTDPTDAATFTSVQTFTDADLADDQYQLVTVNFTSITTTGGHVAIKYNAATAFDAMYIDDFIYEFIPSCAEPSSLTTNAITDTTADLSWVAGNSETEWIVEYATPDFATGTVQQVTGVTSNTNYLLTGLVANTLYEVRVIAVCNATTLSPPSFSTLFTTPPVGPQGVSCSSPGNPFFIYEESFDASSTATSWTGDVGTGSGQFEFGVTGTTGSIGTGPTGPQEGTGYMFFETSGTNIGPRSVVSPAIDLTNANSELELSFFLHSFGGDQTLLEIGYGTSATGPFTNVFSFTGQLQTAMADPFQLVGVALPNSLLGQTVYIQITATEEVGNETGYVGDVALDQMRIETCDATASIDSVEELGFTFYPNPVKDVLSIKGLQNIDSAAVMNMLGQQVMTVEPGVADAQVDMSSLSSGVYLVTVSTNGRSSTIRVVKE